MDATGVGFAFALSQSAGIKDQIHLNNKGEFKWESNPLPLHLNIPEVGGGT